MEFQDLTFTQKDDYVRVSFLSLFYFDIDKGSLEKIGRYKVKGNSIIFPEISETRAARKFSLLLEQGFAQLRNKLNDKKAVYIHKNSGIPLIGHVAFGIVDRGTNLIEVKPITSCNLRCIYCSVDEDRRPVDFVIEEEYLAGEFRKLAEAKDSENIEAHIASQGEPLLYSPLKHLVKDLKGISNVKRVSIDTNGIMLNETRIDGLIAAGLTRFNLSINAMDNRLAGGIAGCLYEIDKIKKTAEYISKKAELLIAPVYLPGINDKEIPKIIEYAKKIGARIGIQNFLNYRFGRNPAKQISWEDFYDQLKKWEQQFSVRLILDESYFQIEKTKELEKPFRKGEIVRLNPSLPGRLKDERIAVSRDRLVSIPNCAKKGIVKARITRTKHNIFVAELC